MKKTGKQKDSVQPKKNTMQSKKSSQESIKSLTYIIRILMLVIVIYIGGFTWWMSYLFSQEKGKQQISEQRVAQERGQGEDTSNINDFEQSDVPVEEQVQNSEQRVEQEGEQGEDTSDVNDFNQSDVPVEEQVQNSPQESNNSREGISETHSTNSENNFNKYNNKEQQNTESAYVLNTNTMKVHYPKCRDVPKIAPDHYKETNETLETILGQGYTRCKHCF